MECVHLSSLKQKLIFYKDTHNKPTQATFLCHTFGCLHIYGTAGVWIHFVCICMLSLFLCRLLQLQSSDRPCNCECDCVPVTDCSPVQVYLPLVMGTDNITEIIICTVFYCRHETELWVLASGLKWIKYWGSFFFWCWLLGGGFTADCSSVLSPSANLCQLIGEIRRIPKWNFCLSEAAAGCDRS